MGSYRDTVYLTQPGQKGSFRLYNSRKETKIIRENLQKKKGVPTRIMEATSLAELVAGDPNAATFRSRLQSKRLSFIESRETDFSFVSVVDLDNLEIREHGKMSDGCIGLIEVACLSSSTMILRRAVRSSGSGGANKKKISYGALIRNGEPLSLTFRLRKGAPQMKLYFDSVFCGSLLTDEAESTRSLDLFGRSQFCVNVLAKLDTLLHERMLTAEPVFYSKIGNPKADVLIRTMHLECLMIAVQQAVTEILIDCARFYYVEKTGLTEGTREARRRQLELRPPTADLESANWAIDFAIVKKHMFGVSSNLVVAIGQKISSREELEKVISFQIGDLDLFAFAHVEVHFHIAYVFKASSVEADTEQAAGCLVKIPFGDTRLARREKYFPDNLNGFVVFPTWACGVSTEPIQKLQQEKELDTAHGPPVKGGGATLYPLAGTAGHLSAVQGRTRGADQQLGVESWIEKLNDFVHLRIGPQVLIRSALKTIVYHQGHTMSGAGNVVHTTDPFVSGAFCGVFGIPTAVLSAQQSALIESMQAHGIRDSASWNDVFGRSCPLDASGFMSPFRELLQTFHSGLVASKSDMTMGTRVEMRLIGKRAKNFSDDESDPNFHYKLSGWDFWDAVMIWAGKNPLDITENLLTLDSYDFYRYLRHCAWQVECEMALCAGVLCRNKYQNLEGRLDLREEMLPRSVILWLLRRGVAFAHLCGDFRLGLGVSTSERVPELFLCSSYISECFAFGHPFSEQSGVRLPLHSDFGDLLALDLTLIIGSTQFETPFKVINLPDYRAAHAVSESKIQARFLMHGYTEIMQRLIVSKATPFQLMYWSLTNPSAQGIRDWSGKQKVVRQQEFEIPVNEGEDEDNMAAPPRPRPREGEDENNVAAPPRPRQRLPHHENGQNNLMERLLRLLALEIVAIFGDACKRETGLLTLKKNKSRVEHDRLFAEALEVFKNNNLAVFTFAFWNELNEKLGEAQQTLMTFQNSRESFSEKIKFILFNGGVYPDGTINPWSRCSAVSVFETSKKQLQLDQENHFEECLQQTLVRLFGRDQAPSTFAFPLFEKRRIRLDNIWTFTDKAATKVIQKKKQKKGKASKAKKNLRDEEASDHSVEADQSIRRKKTK